MATSSYLQAGMALYKIVPKNPYYFWSVMSLVMQVQESFYNMNAEILEWLVTDSKSTVCLFLRQSQPKMKSWLRPCSCLWLNAWWKKWSRRKRLKQKQRWVCWLYDFSVMTMETNLNGQQDSGKIPVTQLLFLKFRISFGFSLTYILSYSSHVGIKKTFSEWNPWHINCQKKTPDFCTLVLTAYMFKMKIQMLEYCTVLTFSL